MIQVQHSLTPTYTEERTLDNDQNILSPGDLGKFTIPLSTHLAARKTATLTDHTGKRHYGSKRYSGPINIWREYSVSVVPMKENSKKVKI